ncbi:hypothetical protein MWU78_04300 [Arenibacter sp. F26102]|uniref:hypothetical protein n=1 Tax=Arenibacter sp. F26102 TaxID=2926416 RepID=UPI001FF341D8|nr:hypothetical protein [Arenibacter sp. F26102]MCK0144865.1 hypothetical protein [Arenibacter sp. F26102]
MADINDDGKKELITGKRFLAHDDNNAGESATPIPIYIEPTPENVPILRSISFTIILDKPR